MGQANGLFNRHAFRLPSFHGASIPCFAPKSLSRVHWINPPFAPPSLFGTDAVKCLVMCSAERHPSLVATLQCDLKPHRVHQRASRMKTQLRLELGFESWEFNLDDGPASILETLPNLVVRALGWAKRRDEHGLASRHCLGRFAAV